MKPGEVWAYREKPRTPGEPLRRVEFLQHGPDRTPRKVRIRWLEGDYDGLDEWVSATRLIAPWDEVDELMAEEEQYLQLLQATRDYDEVLVQAASFVLDHVKELSAASVFMGSSRKTEGFFVAGDLDEVPGMEPSELLNVPNAYITREGGYFGPWEVGVEVAKRICRTEPERVLARVRMSERATRDAIVTGTYRTPMDEFEWEMGEARAEKQMAEEAPVFNLVRSWCGEEATERWDRVSDLEAEVERLQDLVEEMVRWLRHRGHPVKAAEFEKRLTRRDS